MTDAVWRLTFIFIFDCYILSRPLVSRLVFRTQLCFVSKMTDAIWRLTFIFIFDCYILSRPLVSRLVFRTRLFFVSKMTDAIWRLTFIFIFDCYILSRPLVSRLVFRTQLCFVSKMTDAFASVTHRWWDYSHSSFPNVRYIPNNSKYWNLFIRISLNPSNYRTFSIFLSRPSPSTGEYNVL